MTEDHAYDYNIGLQNPSDLSSHSNVGENGHWAFRVNGGHIGEFTENLSTSSCAAANPVIENY